MNLSNEGVCFIDLILERPHSYCDCRALVELIGNRRPRGTFDGNVHFTGAGAKIAPNRASAFLPWVRSRFSDLSPPLT
jgi:hypothetical protein